MSNLGNEGLYYLCSENKGADQLRSYCPADLCLCFRISKKQLTYDAASGKQKYLHITSKDP